VYASVSAANLATNDIAVARIPTAFVCRHRQFVASPDEKMVAVTVDDRHASAVAEILIMQAPIKLAETHVN
jgi:hypothetical protein